jgi:hypothetical protein
MNTPNNILGTIYKNGKEVAEGDIALKDSWDIHFELVRASRILEQMKKNSDQRGSDRAAIFAQMELIQNLRAEHLKAVLGGFS